MAYEIGATGDSESDEIILFTERSPLYGKYNNEFFYDIAKPGDDIETAAGNLLLQIKQRWPTRKITLSEDAELMGIEMENETKYTVIPKNEPYLKPGLGVKIPGIPTNGVLRAHGVNETDFPVFDNDPSMVLNSIDNVQVLTVDEAKSLLEDSVLKWSNGSPEESLLPENFYSSPTNVQAKILSEVVGKYRLHPATDEFVNNALISAVDSPSIELKKANHAMSLTAYLGHYLGEELTSRFRSATTYRVDDVNFLDAEKHTKANSPLSLSNEYRKRQSEAVVSILQDQTERNLSSEELIAENGLIVWNVGLESEETHTLAHVSTFDKNQIEPKPNDEMTQNNKLGMKR